MSATDPLFIVQTWYVPESGSAGFYEIELSGVLDPGPDDRLRLVTRDPAVYRDALQAEGLPIRVVARWHQHGPARVVDQIDPA